MIPHHLFPLAITTTNPPIMTYYGNNKQITTVADVNCPVTSIGLSYTKIAAIRTAEVTKNLHMRSAHYKGGGGGLCFEDDSVNRETIRMPRRSLCASPKHSAGSRHNGADSNLGFRAYLGRMREGGGGAVMLLLPIS